MAGSKNKRKSSQATNKNTSKAQTAKNKSTSSKNDMQSAASRKSQALAIVLFALGLLVTAFILVPGQNVWAMIKHSLYGFFGIGAFIVPIVIIYISIRMAMGKMYGKLKHKVWQSFVLVALVCALIQIISVGKYSGQTFIEVIKNLFEAGKNINGGGVYSALIGWPLLVAFGRVGTIIFIALFMFVFILLVSGATLFDAFKTVSKPAKSIGNKYQNMRENREKTQIDIPIDTDDNMPLHPVSSPKGAYDFDKYAQNDFDDRNDKKTKAEAKANKSSKSKAATPLDDLIKKAMPSDDNNTKTDTDKTTDIFNENDLLKPTYKYPPIELLRAQPVKKGENLSNELKQNAELLVNTLKSFGVQTRVVDISRGPTVTRYELQPSAGVKISKITGLADDIALNLASAGVRIEAPIPNKAAVGIEVPNKNTSVVTLREIIESNAFIKEKSKIAVALGKNIAGDEVMLDLAQMPHLLIAGSTGSGKSVCINSIIMSILYRATPDEVKLLMVDPKVVELGVYNGMPHLLIPVVTDPRKAAGALSWAVTEMLNRYKVFADNGVRDLQSYNALAKTKDELDPMPQIVIIIDELADLMMAAPSEVEDAICRLAQMARAAGMHLVIATQRPSVDVITGLIKANIPSRIAFAVSSQVDSRTILDQGGAEKLLGKGDMLFNPVGAAKPVRVQGCFVTSKEVESVMEFIKSSTEADYDENIKEEIEKQAVKDKKSSKDSGGGFDDEDELLPSAIECVIEANQASTSYLQRKLKVGYARAARLIDDMEAKGIVGAFEGSKPRQVLITKNQWIEMSLNNNNNTDSGEE